MTSRGDSWIFRHPCGCAFGLSDITSVRDTSEASAWRRMYDTAAERREAQARGVTATREAWEDYRHAVYEQLSGSWVCPHKTAEVTS